MFGCSFMFGRRKENTKRYCSVNHRHMGPACQSPNLSFLSLQPPLCLPAAASLLPRPELGCRRRSSASTPSAALVPSSAASVPSPTRSGFASDGQARGSPCSGGGATAVVPPARLHADLRPLRLRKRWLGEGQPMQRGRCRRRNAACPPPCRAPPALTSREAAGRGTARAEGEGPQGPRAMAG